MAEREILEYVDPDSVALLSLTFSGHSGIAEIVRRQAEIFTDRGTNVTVYCFESDVEPEGYDVVELYAPENEYLTRVYRIVWPLLVFPLLSLVLSLRSNEAVISHKYPFNVACAVAATVDGPEYVYYDHGVAPPELYDSVVAKTYSRLMRRLQAVSARPATTVIAISEFVATELVEEWGPRATAIVYNSPSSFIEDYEPDLRDVRSYHDIPEDAPVVLFVGRVTRHKNVHCLIQAHEMLATDADEAPHLVIVGKPTQKQYHERLTAIAGNKVRFAGYVDEQYLASYFAQADVYATASLWEGCNLTVIEAQQIGTPVVAFDAGAHSETVESPPGRLVEKGDCGALARNIGQVLDAR